MLAFIENVKNGVIIHTSGCKNDQLVFVLLLIDTHTGIYLPYHILLRFHYYTWTECKLSVVQKFTCLFEERFGILSHYANIDCNIQLVTSQSEIKELLKLFVYKPFIQNPTRRPSVDLLNHLFEELGYFATRDNIRQWL